MNSIQLQLHPTPPFDFAAAAFSHGWARLAPNSWDEATRVLGRVEQLDSGQVVDLRISDTGDALQPLIAIDVLSAAPLSAADRVEITRPLVADPRAARRDRVALRWQPLPATQ